MSVYKISVLVPIFKHDSDLVNKCLWSIHKQIIDNIEVILIDNEATIQNKRLIDRYIEVDSRFKKISIIRNQGYGYAMNQALKIAQGEYVGIVESDDIIDPKMYEHLTKLAQSTDSDIVKCSFYEMNDNAKKVLGIKYASADKILTRNSSVEIIYKPISYWTGIYKKKLLDQYNITWVETPGATGQDVNFFLKVWSVAQSIFLTNEPLYYYRTDNQNQSIYCHNDNAWGAHKNYSELYDFISNIKIDPSVTAYIKSREIWNKLTILQWVTQDKAAFYRLCYNTIKKLDTNTLNLIGTIKPALFKQIKDFNAAYPFNLLKSYILQFNKFKTQTRISVLSVLNINIFFSEFSLSLLNFKLLQVNYKKNSFKIQIIGLPVFSSFILKNNSHVYKILHGLFRYEKGNDYSKYTFLGINKLFRKNINLREKNSLEVYHDILKKIVINQQILFDCQYAQQNSHFYHSLFKKYNNIYANKKVVLVACGNTCNYYSPIQDAIHVGVNRAFLLENINFDFIFAQDNLQCEQSLLNEYRPKSCTKFYGVIPPNRLNLCRKDGISPIAESDYKISNAHRYFLNGTVDSLWPIDISTEPLKDHSSTVFSALQFILYTGAKEIYLVGCDCTDGDHFYGGKNTKFSKTIPYWRTFKDYIKERHPDVSIVSINPIGLNGLFKDVNTK